MLLGWQGAEPWAEPGDAMGIEHCGAIRRLGRDELRKAMIRADICPLGGYLMSRDIVHLRREGKLKDFRADTWQPPSVLLTK